MLYPEHQYLLDSPRLGKYDRIHVERILSGCMDEVELQGSLKALSIYLKDHHQKNAWILWFFCLA